MKDKFINTKVVGIIYKNLQEKFQLNLDPDDKSKLTKKTVKVMNEVYNNIDPSRVTTKNFDHILKQYVNNCYTIVYNDLNKDDSSKQQKKSNGRVENFSMESKMDRDRQLNKTSQVRVDPRAESMRSFESNNGYSRDSNFASFDQAFQSNQRSTNERRDFQGRFEPPSDNGGGRKSEQKDDLDKKYQSMQSDYRQTFQNQRPSTPPELKGDGGANLSKLARENMKNKQAQNAPSRGPGQGQQGQGQVSNTGNNSKYPGSKDTFDFGTANDVDNNYDTLDGNKGDFEGNMNIWNTGIDPQKFNIDENVSLEKKLAEYQRDRELIDGKGQGEGKQGQQGQNRQQDSAQSEQFQQNRQQKKQVSFNDESNNDDRQNQMMQQQMYQQQQQQMKQQQQMQQMKQHQQMQQQQQQQQMQQQQQQPRVYQQNNEEQQYYEEQGQGQGQMQMQGQGQGQMQGQGFDPNLKIQEYEETIELLLEKVRGLQHQQIKHMNSGKDDTDDKIRLLESKKGDIMNEIGRLQFMTSDLEKQQEILSQKEQYILKRERELESKSKMGSGIEKVILMKSNSGKFTHTLTTPLNNITAIELVNYNIPYDDHNINSYNNKFYFSISIENKDKTDSESDDDILTTDSENYIDETNINSTKVTVITIPEDNYDIYGLLEMMNKIGNKRSIQFSLIKGRVIIKTAKANKLKLFIDKEYSNNILHNLGFTKSSLKTDKYKCIAEKRYNLKNEKNIQIYLKNIMNEPFAEFLAGNFKIHKFSKEVSIENLNRIDVELRINDKSFIPLEPYALEFNIIMDPSNEVFLKKTSLKKTSAKKASPKQTSRKTSRHIEPIKEIIKETAPGSESSTDVNTEDNDLLNKVSNLMNL